MDSGKYNTGSAKMKRLLSSAAPRSLIDPLPFNVDGRDISHEQVVELLRPYVTPERRARIDSVISGRTATLATVIDGIVNAGNVSAVMRSAEALGVLPFHIITGGDAYKHSKRTSQGAEKWLDVRRWASASECACHLKKSGYRLVAAHLDETAVPVSSLDFSRRTALVFGNERDGISPEILKQADAKCAVPMDGFAQSFNISVAAALCLYHARQERGDQHADLSHREQSSLRAAYYLRSVGRAEDILRRELTGTAVNQ